MSNERILQRRGLMLVLSSPSGAGKTTLSRRLLESDHDIAMSVSATTRAAAPERDRGQGLFLRHARRVRPDGAGRRFLEHATVFGNRYGTPKAAGDDGAGSGAATCCSTSTGRAPSSCTSRRATIWSASSSCRQPCRAGTAAADRAQDSERSWSGAHGQGRDEISHWAEYDYVIVNDDRGQRALAEHRRPSWMPSG